MKSGRPISKGSLVSKSSSIYIYIYKLPDVKIACSKSHSTETTSEQDMQFSNFDFINLTQNKIKNAIRCNTCRNIRLNVRF